MKPKSLDQRSRAMNTVCRLIIGCFVGAGVGFLIVVALSLPVITMTFGPAHHAWADPVMLLIFLVGGSAGIVTAVRITMGRRRTGTDPRMTTQRPRERRG